jgi:hypothetical protein
MEKVGMPDQHFALFWQEAPPSVTPPPHRRMPALLEKALGVGLSGHLLGNKAHGFGAEIGQAMAAGVINQGAATLRYVLEGNPNSTHKSEWVAMEMDGIAVIRLLTAYGKVECLKGKRFTPIELAQQIKNDRLQSEPADSGMLLPAILQARWSSLPSLPLAEMFREKRFQLVDHRMDAV